MKLIEEITRINSILNINEGSDGSKNARMVDILIRSLYGKLNMVRFRDFNEDEYVWITDYNDNIDYGNVGYNRYVTEHGEDSIPFYKNSWGKLFIFDCDFFNTYMDNFVSNRDEDKERGSINQKHYNMIKDYMKEKYNLEIKIVDEYGCDEW